MAKPPATTIEDMTADLASAIPFGLNRLARRGMNDQLIRTDPELLSALWKRRDELRSEFPAETLTPMLGASVLSTILRAGIDDDIRAPLTVAARRSPWRKLILFGLLGGGAYLLYKRVYAGGSEPSTDWSTDPAGPVSVRPPIDDDTPISLLDDPT